MKFEIISKYNIGDKVLLKNQHLVSIYDIKLKLFDRYYRIMYLVEFENLERKWIDETDIQEMNNV